MECPGVPLLTLLTSHDEKAAVAGRGRGRTDKRGGDSNINGERITKGESEIQTKRSSTNHPDPVSKQTLKSWDNRGQLSLKDWTYLQTCD